MGICCHLGDDLARIESLLRAGTALPFDLWQPETPYQARCRRAGLYKGELAGDRRDVRFMGRAARLAYHAAQAALAQSQLSRRDIAVVAGSGTGDIASIAELYESLARSRSTRRASPTAIPRIMASTVSANLAAALKTTGPSFTASAACAGGAMNLVLAAELIEHGHTEAALAGGSEVPDSLFHAGFEAMGAYCRDGDETPGRASRPYAADRAGFIFGEGAGFVVLETRAAAAARGAKVLGVIRGYGMSSNGGGDMVHPSSDGALRAMQRAVAHAGIRVDDIDYINTHGTSTPYGDLSEVSAIRRLMDGRHVAYSSTKGYTGHTISAAGAIEAIVTCSMLRGGWIAPSVNAEPLDPELADYAPVLRPVSRPLKVALSNSLGFGGSNVCMVLERPA